MTQITELRALLLDARIALRSALPGFDEDPLRARLEQTLLNLTEQLVPPTGSGANTKTTAQQVALAWQTVCRGLKLSQPALYDELAAKVMSLLDERELVEPVAELLQMEAQVKQMETRQKALQNRLTEKDRKAAEIQERLDQLYQALATAAPEITAAPDAQALALMRVAALVATPRANTAPSGAKVEAAPPPDAPVPDRRVLEAVQSGVRPLSPAQREWCVAECLALTGWQFTPVELIERGDAWMAEQILAAPNAPA
jgi:hypothetical protein